MRKSISLALTKLATLGISLAVVVQAEAQFFDVTISGNATPESSPVFGVSVSESAPAVVSFRIDASNPIVIPAGTKLGPFEDDTYVTDLYGYTKQALSDLSASYGSKAWDGDDVEDAPFGGYELNPSAAVWFAGPVLAGATPIATILLADTDGGLVTGGAACGLAEFDGRCALSDRVEVFEFFGAFALGGDLEITISPYGVESVAVDIKPGVFPNSINLGSAGVVPVAILSSPTFDATTVSPDSVTLAGAAVRLVGKTDRYLCHSDDVNADGLLDFVCQVETVDFLLVPGDSQAMLEATTADGTRILGTDSIAIVPNK